MRRQASGGDGVLASVRGPGRSTRMTEVAHSPPRLHRCRALTLPQNCATLHLSIWWMAPHSVGHTLTHSLTHPLSHPLILVRVIHQSVHFQGLSPFTPYQCILGAPPPVATTLTVTHAGELTWLERLRHMMERHPVCDCECAPQLVPRSAPPCERVHNTASHFSVSHGVVVCLPVCES